MDREELKKYLSSKYQGSEWFLEKVIHPVFGDTGDDDVDSGELLDKYPELRPVAEKTGISSVKEIWEIFVGMQPLLIFDVTVNDHIMMNRNRVGVQNIVRRIMDKYSYAFMIFHYDNDMQWDWRFSYCHKGSKESETTESKRFTFLLGPRQSCLTAASNFMKLEAKHGDISDDDLETAFSVEALSNEFFDKYKKRYEKFVSYITGKAYVKSGSKYVEKVVNTENDKTLYAAFGNDDKRVRDYVKRLLGRILFLHFVQKKGWLGLPDGEAWDSNKGDLDFMKRLYDNASPEQQDDFLYAVLEPLFTAIDTNRSDNSYLYDTKVFGCLHVPYLNGGLFERDADDEIPSRFPKEYFADLLEFLSQYNFTVDENDPNDAQVGIDPEMLSRIFENLLEDNKDKGAYYTPKEVVHYMCRESLIAYLQTGYEDKAQQDAIRQFVETQNADCIATIKEDIDNQLKEVKICDPAIGSGAFPMGMLKEIFLCRSELEKVTDAAQIKREIIQNNIYGVDIEKGAVEIARLRFWLTLIVDEKTPETLPNLDFKIMQGNSLVTTYRGLYINLDTKHDLQRQSYTKIMHDMRELTKEQKAFYNSNGEERSEHEINIKHLILDSIISQLDYELGSWKATKYATPDIFGGEAAKAKKTKYTQDFSKERMDILSDCRKLDELLLDPAKSLKERSQINVPFFDWHIMFNDVFNRPNGANGFDIVIGNPPYVQLQSNEGALAKMYEDAQFASFTRTGDIYCLFYERGWQLLKNGGHLCYITSNKWMRAGYGEKLRKFIANSTNPKMLIDFAGLKIFESATVDTNILLFEKGKNKRNTICVNANKDYRNCLHNLSNFVQQQHTVNAFTSSDSWVILSPIEQSIKQKIEAVGVPLKDWDIQINYGIKTGCNEAFIINTEKRNEILDNCKDEAERKRTEELIRPILRGRDIKRYEYSWADLYLIATFPARHYDIEQYPAVKAYLLSFAEDYLRKNGCEWVVADYLADYCRQKLSQTGKFIVINGTELSISGKKEKARKKTSNKWFETQDSISYWEDFDKPKIVYPETTQGAYFAFDDKGFYIDKTCFILISNDAEYLQHTLSSRLFEFAYKCIFASVELGEHGYQYNKHALVKLPVIKPSKSFKFDDNDIDSQIYKLYNISKTEIDEIESI